MSTIFYPDEHSNSPVQASVEHPFPVQIRGDAYLPPVSGDCNKRVMIVPGIGTGAAYTAGDAFGTVITFRDVFRYGKHSGWVTKVVYYDKDDEGLQKDVMFFDTAVSTTADNAAYAPTDADIQSGEGFVSITTFINMANNQEGQWTGAHRVRSQDTNLYARLITQGADNITAGQEPRIAIWVDPD